MIAQWAKGIALGDDRAAYFDPWVVSRIVQEGTAESVRRVTLVSK